MTSLFQELEENWLFRARKPQNFTGRDVADLAFLYMVTLHILRCEYDTAPFAINYAKRTNIHSNFRTVDRLSTDLYQFLNILNDTGGVVSQQLANQDANDVLWDEVRFNPTTVKQFLSNVASAKYNSDAQKRLLFQIENQLYVTVSNYRSMRRIAVEWNGPLISAESQKLVITRMLQALRAKARRGDILPSLEKVSSRNRYELKKVCNPETGEGCDANEKSSGTPRTATAEKPPKERIGLLKSIAIGALAAHAISHALQGKK